MRCWRCDSKVGDHAASCRSCGAALIHGEQPTPREVALTLAGGIGSPWAARATSHWVLWTRVAAVLALAVSPLLFGVAGTLTLRRALRSHERGAAEARSLLHACTIAGVMVNAAVYLYLSSR
jgi:hypothetical protein